MPADLATCFFGLKNDEEEVFWFLVQVDVGLSCFQHHWDFLFLRCGASNNVSPFVGELGGLKGSSVNCF